MRFENVAGTNINKSHAYTGRRFNNFLAISFVCIIEHNTICILFSRLKYYLHSYTYIVMDRGQRLVG